MTNMDIFDSAINDIKISNKYDILKHYNNIESSENGKIFTPKIPKLQILFPYTKNYNQLKIDKKSLYYISTYKIANRITSVVDSMIKQLKLNKNNISITDCCAGVGGNTISFAKYFKNVNAIEINKTRCEYLINNLQVYNLNVNVYHGDFIKINKDIKSDVVFIDPPWGGRDYKSIDKLKLYLSNVNIADLCNMLLQNSKLIVIKIPFNFDIDNFNDIVKHDKKIYKFFKMNVLCVY